MSSTRFLQRAVAFLALVATSLALTTPARSADIDLYAGTAGSVAAPNVLVFIDNSSNWSAANQAWTKAGVTAKCNAMSDATKKKLCLFYVDQVFGTDTSLKQGQVQLRALKLVLNSLVCTATTPLNINVGLMLYNENGSVDGGQAVYTSGYIRWAIKNLDATYCATLLADLDNIDSNITGPNFKGASSANYSSALYEAFKYFGGWTNPSGAASGTAGSPVGATGFGPTRYSLANSLEDVNAFTNASKNTYRSPISSTGACGNNYIVLIGNTWPNQEPDTNTNSSPNPTNTTLSRLGYTPAQIYPIPLQNNDKSKVRFGDEWAKFLATADVSSADGVQSVKMFTVDTWNASADANQGALLKSMADQSGPGGYYTIGGDLYALVAAFTDIFTQIAAADSIFASASLPVSVNAQGTFLNQVFMGVFRPNVDGYQRWTGNLKQYQFALDNTNNLFLADANGTSAVDTVNTGFIQNCATSFWTSDSGTYWQSISGGRASGCLPPTNTNNLYSDAPDGPLVEKGGAGQKLRALGHASRTLKTCSSLATCPSTPVDFNTSLAGLTGFLTSAAGGSMSSSEANTLIDWVRGKNTGDGSVTSAGVVTYTSYGLAATATRPTVHGEVVHSRPLAVNYGTGTTNDIVVFYGAGDGTLRAVNGNQTGGTAGNELWAFIAPEHWASLNRLRTNSPVVQYKNTTLAAYTPTPTPKSYFFDGSMGAYQERTSSTISKVWLYATMRRGGRMVYAFDATTKPGAGDPSLLWRFGCQPDGTCIGGTANIDRIGQTWSTPAVIRVKGNTTPLVVFGAGYDDCEDNEDPDTACASINRGKGIFVLGGQTGPADAANYAYLDPNATDTSFTGGRFVGDMATVDLNADGFTDVIYAADTRGNVYRIRTSDSTFNGTAPSTWTMVRIAVASQWAASLTERRKFMNAPSVVPLGSGKVIVLIGTGDREKPYSTGNGSQVNNRFYGFYDNVNTTPASPIIGYGSAPPSPPLFNATGTVSVDPATLSTYGGWYRELSTSAAPYEQVVTTPLTLGGITYFSTFQASSSGSSCSGLGTGRAYQIDFQTGSQTNGLQVVTTYVAQGIPPSPVGGIVTVNGKTVPFLIGGPTSSPIAPMKVIPKVKANRKPIYRFQRIEN